ncbi:MAG: PAS domain S-box protein [Gemmatimonadetes bacterium]|nr:PAS domain S-box protein [Gemmatimonadota bacterium]
MSLFRGEEVTRKALKTWIGFRFLVVSVLLGLGIALLHGKGGDDQTPFFVLLCATAVLSLTYWVAASKAGSPRFQAVCQLVIDVVLVSCMVHYTGGVSSPLALLYVLVISAGSSFLLVRGTLFLAILCTAAYAMLLGVEQTGFLSPAFDGPAAGAESMRLVALQITLYGITFLSLALLSGYLSFRVYRRGVALKAVRSRLHQVNLDTDQILRSMSSGLLSVDRDGLVVHFNPAAAQIFGVEANDAIGETCEEILARRAPRLLEMIREILAGGEDVLREETDIECVDGTSTPIGVSGTCLHAHDQTIAGVVAIFQDLTEVRKMQEQIRQSDRLAAIGELSAGIAHEIRNPLATISGSIQVLQNELPVQGEQVRLLGLIVKESDRLHRIMEDFLDFARPRPTNKVRVRLPQMLRDMISLLENHPKRRKGVSVRFETDENDLVVMLDDEQIRRVFINLAVNGMEAIEERGVVAIRLERAPMRHEGGTDGENGDWVRIVFEDDGVGIAESARTELFDPFFTTKKGGTGLGLSIAQKIVLSHGGRIDVESGAKGTRFTVHLPGAAVGTGEELLVS